MKRSTARDSFSRSLRNFSTILMLAIGCTFASTLAAPKPDTAHIRPRLTVIMVVDQMRADYLTRWTSVYSGGLHRLSANGAVFTNARHDHAITQTAVGHATIATGTLPSRNGIVSNSYFDRHSGKVISATIDPDTKLIGGSEGTGSSSKNLLHPALGDWIKAQTTGTRVFAISLKERAAVLPGGLAPDGVFWYDDLSGNFVTSSYYAQQLPTWVTQFNSSDVKDTWRDSIWTKTDPTLAYQGDDGVLVEYDGVHNVFPHRLSDLSQPPDTGYYTDLYGSPFGDALLLKFGSELILHEDLGHDTVPDVLFMSLSSADAIGHAFGPDSHEIEDYYLRLDKYLSPLFKMLDANVGQGKYLFVLAGDHGVSPLPEIEAARGNTSARRVRTDEYQADVRLAVTRAFPNCTKADSLVNFVGLNILLNDQYVTACSLDVPEARRRIASAIQHISYVADVFTYDQLSSDSGDPRPYAQQFLNSFRTDRSPDLMVNFLEWVLVIGSSFGTSHGTPYPYDADVPLIFYGAGIRPEIYTQPVRTVDIAPTVSTIMGVPPPDDLDGQAILNLQ